MFSPKYGGGQGFGGGMPYGVMPLPGRPTAVPHPATLAGTSAYQQVGWHIMQPAVFCARLLPPPSMSGMPFGSFYRGDAL